jgi:glycogen debranching enzyme
MAVDRLLRRGLRLLRHGHSTLIADLGDSLTAKAGSLFVLCGPDGDVDCRQNEGHGIYFHDTRYLGRAMLRLEHRRLAVLLSSDSGDDRTVCELTNPDLELSDGTLLRKEHLGIRRERVLSDRIVERLTVQNFATREVLINLQLTFDDGFEDMFVVRGHEPGRRGHVRHPWWEGGQLRFAYAGADGRTRSAALAFDPAPERRGHAGELSYALRLPRGGQAVIQVTIGLTDEGPGALEPVPVPVRGHPGLRAAAVTTSNPLFDRVLERSFRDLRMLLTRERGSTFFAAGVPWFVALFGRDSIITALQMLAYDRGIAATTLKLLAQHQGRVEDHGRGEEPGKILHELRIGEMANLGEVPQTPYYGTVDATPLFLILLVEYLRWSDDRQLWRRLRPAAEAALAWIERWGDSDGDGFVDYRAGVGHGLDNQGWKDSWNSMVHPDGTLAEPPIALVEVQGYVYRAWRGMAWLLRREGEAAAAERLEAKAADLRRRFAAAFWMPRRRYLALALERGGRQVTTLTSNPGQALWGGIVEERHAAAVAGALLGPRLFSGWGVRTVAKGEDCYNPIDYHVGTVWPHDNSLIAAGLKRCGRDAATLELFTGVFEAATRFRNYRLPELFAGFPRDQYAVPVRYPVACSPQAWSAGSLPFLLTTCLGLEPDSTRGLLEVRRPALPPWLPEVTLTDLRVGESRTALRFRLEAEGVRVSVLERHADLEVRVTG